MKWHLESPVKNEPTKVVGQSREIYCLYFLTNKVPVCRFTFCFVFIFVFTYKTYIPPGEIKLPFYPRVTFTQMYFKVKCRSLQIDTIVLSGLVIFNCNFHSEIRLEVVLCSCYMIWMLCFEHEIEKETSCSLYIWCSLPNKNIHSKVYKKPNSIRRRLYYRTECKSLGIFFGCDYIVFRFDF